MSTNRIYNEVPRPHALLQNLPEDVAQRVAPLFTDPRLVQETDRVHEDEFDVQVTVGALKRARHLHVVVFGAANLGTVTFEDDNLKDPEAFYGASRTLASTLRIPENITGELGHLVQTHLVPLFTAQERKGRLHVSAMRRMTGTTWQRTELEASRACTPFLLAGDGSVLAGAITLDGGGRCWFLPKDCPTPEVWVAAALKEFHELTPDRVPGLPRWWERPDWATPGQRRAREAAAELEAERERLLADLDRRLADARGDVDRADVDAAAGVGRLLTSDGTGLAEAAQIALEALGFTVRDMDQVTQEGQRREDLRVTDPAVAGWEAIVEVKGYTAGARVNDLARVLRWKAHFVKDTGREPDALWHVVNAFRRTDPAARPTAIPDEGDLANLTEENGVLIDTRELFRAQRDVETGAADPAVVRASLRATAGRWIFQAELHTGTGDAASADAEAGS